MYKLRTNISFIIIAFIVSSMSFSQEKKNDTIKTEVVNVVKPYTPTISDAFKIKERPSTNNDQALTKKKVKYNIFSIPVASTFTPAKGKATSVTKKKPVKLFDNYASLGVGTFTTIVGDVYLNHKLSRSESVGGYFSHHSSQGEIDGLLLDDDFSETGLAINYSKQMRDFSWKIDLGYQNQNYNWYGLPQPFFDETTADTLNVKHTFNSFFAGGKIKFEDAIINNGSVRFRRFTDNQGSGENRFVAKADFNVPIQDEIIASELTIDYLNGTFDRNFYANNKLKYGNVSIGLKPSYQLKEDDLTVNLGVNLVYLNDTEGGKNKFFIYPSITASYRLVNDIMIAYGGIEGGLIQNSYHDFSQANPFVSPTLLIVPTDQQYNASLGLKGRLSNNISYDVSGNYISEKAKPLFKTNSVLSGATEDYQFGNSFGVIYDNIDTFSVAGELSVDVNKNFTLGIKAEYFTYSTDNEAEAWNLPDITGSLFTEILIDEHWFAGASLFYVGERKDQFFVEGTLIDTAPITMTLNSYFDANAHVGYKINDQFSAFIKANNIASNEYNKWLNYPVQGIQFLAGLTYQFDF